MKKYEFLVTEKKENVAIIRINRPDAMNRIHRAAMVEFVGALSDADNDSDIKAVILTGTGEYFCGGGQVDSFPDGSVMEQRAYANAFIDMQRQIYKMKKPVIAAVQGKAIAGGLSLMAACDLAIAGEDCLFGLPEIKNGLFPMLALAVMEKGLDKKRVFELAFTGKLVDADTVERWNLVNEVVTMDKVMERTVELAEQIAAQSSVAMLFGRDAYYKMVEMGLDSALEYGNTALLNLLWTVDAREAAHANAEGRKPEFIGK